MSIRGRQEAAIDFLESNDYRFLNTGKLFIFMYLDYFRFKQEPFNLTPDPKFFFLSKQHLVALETLQYGIAEKKGFMSLTGEVGTGKTTICRTLMSRLGSNVEIALIVNSMVSVYGLMKAINKDFGLEVSENTVEALIENLHDFLLELVKNGKSAVVIIDEAQNLSVEALEMVRLLSNLETDTEKLLQLILVGQPELDQKLQDHRLRQLAQRVTIRAHIGVLDLEECSHYIIHRIMIAGGDRKITFDRRSLKYIFQQSKGYPRLINAISDRTLLVAYANKSKLINLAMVKKAVQDLKGQRHQIWG